MAEKVRKVMKLEKLLVMTSDKDICKMMHTTGSCEATVLVKENKMAYVLPATENENQGIVMPLMELLETCSSYKQIEGNKYSVDVVIDGAKTIKNMHKNIVEPISRNSLAKKLGIPNVTLEQWENGKRKPAPYVTNLIEYWLKNEGYLKRRFAFGLLTYDEYTTTTSQEVDWGTVPEVQADSLDEAIEIFFDCLIEKTIDCNEMLSRDCIDCDNVDMLIFQSTDGLGIYQDNLETPYKIEENMLIWGMKRTENNELEYYRVVEDDDDPKGFKYILTKTEYISNIQEYVLSDEYND